MRTEPGIHLIPDNWNDFYFYTLFDVEYIDEKSINSKLGQVKIGFEYQTTEETTKDKLNNLLKSQNNILSKLPDNFFSLGQSSKYYKNIKQLEDDDLRIKILTALNDMAFNDKIMENYEKQEVLKTSLMREINRYNYENQLKRIAGGGNILTKFNFSYCLEFNGKNEKLNFEVVPDTLPPTNLHAVIGTNGVGKTTVLKGIMREYTDGNLKNDFANLVFISFSAFDKIPDIDDEQNSFSYVGLKKGSNETKNDVEINKEFNEAILSIFTRKKHYHLYKMFEILNNADYNFNKLNFVSILDKYLESDREENDMKLYAENIVAKFDNLSSGHKIILLSIAKIVELIVEKTLVLIDEPETHLHPPLLSAYIRCLSELLVVENGVGIVATHSSVVLQEVPKSVVSIIRKYGKAFEVIRPKIETFGENTGVLNEEVFGLEINNTGFHKLLKDAVQKFKNYDEVLEEFDDQLSLDAKTIVRSYINEIDEDF